MKPKKGKQNKKDNEDHQKDYQKLYTEQKSQALSKAMLYESIQSHNHVISKENLKLKTEFKESRQVSDEMINNLKFYVQILEERNKELVTSKRQIQIKHNTIKVNNEALLSEYETFKNLKENQIQELKRKAELERKDYTSTLSEYQTSVSLYNKLKQHNITLQKQLMQAREKIKQISADKDCERILTVDTLKRQMMKKANEMKNKAIEIHKEQLDATTRLTYLQNDQLVRQLEYQSSNTDKILKRNCELEAEVKQLRQKIEILGEVEGEILKRNIYAKNMIKKYVDENSKQKFVERVERPQQQKKRQKVKIDDKNTEIEDLHEKILCQEEAIKNLEEKNGKLTKLNNIKKKQKSQSLLSPPSRQSHLPKLPDIIILLCRYYEGFLTTQTVSSIEKPVEQWEIQQVKTIVEKLVRIIEPHIGVSGKRFNQYRKNLEKQYINYEELKEENMHVSKYIGALKRIKEQKNKENILFKGRSLTNLTSSFKNKPKNSQSINLQSISKKFMKPKNI